MRRPVLVGEEPVRKTLCGGKRVVAVVQRAEQGKASGGDLDRAKGRCTPVQAHLCTIWRT